jgi:rhamnosyltransferase subunit B
MARIILVTIGSLGDLHPFIGVARELKSLGHDPVMAVPTNHIDSCRAAGLEAHGVFPDYESLAEEIGEAPEIIVRKVMADPDFLIRQIMLRGLATSAEKVDKLMDGASLVITSMFALAAPIIAEKRNVPLATLVLQPIAILSATAPSFMPEMPIFMRQKPGRFGQAWNRLLCNLMRGEMKRRYGKALNLVRYAHGLNAIRVPPIFDVEGNVVLRIATYDPLFASIPTDAPANIKITGFPNFDSASNEDDSLPAHLETFLSNGPPPIVFTLGSFAVFAPGCFYSESVRAARLLGHRAVLLIGVDGSPPDDLGPDVCVVTYAPHSKLFPRAVCIVHHGGIGTTGQALMSGKPQLIVPFMGDQPDNASRIIALGVGSQLSAKTYTAKRAETQLKRLLENQMISNRAKAFAGQMIKNGAERAAVVIVEALATRCISL